MLCALMYRQNGDLANLLKSAGKKVPQSGRLSAGEGGGGAIAIWAMPKCLRNSNFVGASLIRAMPERKHLFL